ncbi:methyl-accepting chemotaxis protein [Salinicola avicenniae]|uniref:methyl-accepting chemotaxis protein n=1 Tax=Salinicola avicenniae TaxID=2916836 RepID=UPI002074017B|nr:MULTISPECIES: methyl-accepting chemotaxis protein [unclassified Salinicola]
MRRLFNNLSVNTSLTAMLIVFSLLILLTAGLGYLVDRKGETALDELNAINVHQLNAFNLTWAHLADVQLDSTKAARALEQRNTERASHYLALAQEAMALAAHRHQQFADEPKSPRGQPLANAIEETYQHLVDDGIAPQLDALNRGDMAAFEALLPEVEATFAEFHHVGQDFIDYADARGAGLMAEITAFQQRADLIKIGVLLLAIVIVVMVRQGIARTIVRPLRQAATHFEAIAGGDFTRPIHVDGRNEIGTLFRAMREMQTGLSSTVLTVRQASGAIHVGSRDIAQGNMDLSVRTDEQAASLQETAASMDQITETVKQNADNAAQGNTLAGEASASASQGAEVIAAVTSTMQAISESAKRIHEIIGVLDAITFQTNLLALNASVEAARAGEHGKGFAVVADEVRNLASRSADSAREIRGLIETSNRQVADGDRLVKEADGAMQTLQSSIRQVADIMQEISAASREQSMGISQVNQAVGLMDEVTQQNAAQVQQAATAAQTLEQQANQLADAVATFRLEESERGSHLQSAASRTSEAGTPALQATFA